MVGRPLGKVFLWPSAGTMDSDGEGCSSPRLFREHGGHVRCAHISQINPYARGGVGPCHLLPMLAARLCYTSWWWELLSSQLLLPLTQSCFPVCFSPQTSGVSPAPQKGGWICSPSVPCLDKWAALGVVGLGDVPYVRPGLPDLCLGCLCISANRYVLEHAEMLGV